MSTGEHTAVKDCSCLASLFLPSRCGSAACNFGLGPVTSRAPAYLGRYSDFLRAGRSADRIPVRARFSAPVQTGPGAHPASNTVSTGSLPGVKRPGRGVDHPPPLAPRLKKE